MEDHSPDVSRHVGSEARRESIGVSGTPPSKHAAQSRASEAPRRRGAFDHSMPTPGDATPIERGHAVVTGTFFRPRDCRQHVVRNEGRAPTTGLRTPRSAHSCGLGATIYSAPDRSDQRQLLLPVVLPHERMLPGRAGEIVARSPERGVDEDESSGFRRAPRLYSPLQCS